MVSIIIPTVNRAALLLQTLQSIADLNTDVALFEVIVVDNCSCDNTKQTVEAFKLKNQNLSVFYFFEEIPGLLSARHKGFFEAKGDILAFIDDDVILTQNWLNAIIETLNVRTDISLLTGPTLPKYEEIPPVWLDYFWTEDIRGKHCGWLSLMDFGNQIKEIDAIFVWGLNFIIRKESLISLQGFNPDNVPANYQIFQGDGETGLAIKAKKNNFKALYNPEVKLYHVVPRERLTHEYFEKRAFYQGVANSFTMLKNNSLEISEISQTSIFKKIKRKIFKTIGITKQNILPLEIIDLKEKLLSKEKEGFQFHREAYQNNALVKIWVEKENYLDYNLPKNA